LVSIERNRFVKAAEIVRRESRLTLENTLDELNVRYIELQCHGDVKITDESSMCFTRDIPLGIQLRD